ncbi:MAG: aldo/keto reductase, partial [Candidatus Hodarchaeales archaeon]
MGCWAFGVEKYWGNQKEKDSINTVISALDCGINFFDTAAGYGYSEHILGKALKAKRSKAVIASKVQKYSLKKEDLILACENSLKRLDTEYIDLYYIHFPNPNTPLEDTMEGMEQLKRQGKIRAIGVCNFGLKYLNRLSAIGKLDLVEIHQLPYSLLWRAIEYEIKQSMIEKNIGIVCYSPLAQGLLTGLYNKVDDVPDHLKITRYYHYKHQNADHGEKGCEEEVFSAIERIREICEEFNLPMAQVAIAWLLYQPGISCVIPGARKPEEIINNVKAVEIHLNNKMLHKLTKATEVVKKKIGNNPDMWKNI